MMDRYSLKLGMLSALVKNPTGGFCRYKDAMEEIETLRQERDHYKRVLRVIGRCVEDAGLDDEWEE